MFKGKQSAVKEEKASNVPVRGQADEPRFQFECAPVLLAWLQQHQVSLGFTASRINKVFLVGRQPNAPSLVFHHTTFEQPRGLVSSTDGEQLIMGSFYQIWRFSNAVPPAMVNMFYDKVYIPHVGYTTGECGAHDLGFDNNGSIIFVNTQFSCLAKVSETKSFISIWSPPFISSNSVAEDRCHLNGLAFREGEPRYVTGFSQTDTTKGWREHRKEGGFVMDIQTNEVVCEGLSMPHSPRWYQNRLWLLNSGEGQFGYVDMAIKKFKPITFCPGYARGLNFHGQFALIGLSKPRHNKAFEGLVLDKELTRRGIPAFAGLQLVNLQTHQSIQALSIDPIINEICDVILIPNTRTPKSLGFRTEEILKTIAFGANNFEPAKENEPANLIAETSSSPRSASVPEETPMYLRISDGLLSWMDEQTVSFALSLQLGPKAAKLLLFGKKPEGGASIVIRDFEHCGILAVSENSRKLYMYDFRKIQYFKNTLTSGQQYQGYDACFIPHKNQDPQGTDIVDLRVDDEVFLFISSPSSCLAMLPRFDTRLFTDWSFSDLHVGDQLKSPRLTGLALCEGDLRYVTATAIIGSSQTIGLVIDTEKNSIIATNLLHPHSPRWHGGKLWLLDEGLQELGYVDPEKNVFKAVFKCPDGTNAKGLEFCGDTAVLGITQKKLGGTYRCSVLFVQITPERAEIKHWLQLSGDKISLEAICLLPGIKRPYLLDMREESVIPLETSSEKLSEKNGSEDSDLVNPAGWVEDLAIDDPQDITPVSSTLHCFTRKDPTSHTLTYSSSLFSFWQHHKRPVLLGIGVATGVAALAVALAYQEEDSDKATLSM